VRFYLDEDLSPVIAAILRGWGVDAISCDECGRNGLSDEEQLNFAGVEGQCVVTRNRDDFIGQTVLFFEQGRPHVGLLIAPRTIPANRFSALARAIREYADTHPKGMQPYTYDFLHV
jgi:predicted nuclease of predicted toxin-antitoxin system